MFQFDSSWDVGKEAESLNTSLFGKAKKKGHQLSSSPLAKKSSGLFTSIIHDSDDEIFSKKGKKRLKERRRKKKKNDGTSNMTNTSEVGASSDGENEDLVQPVIREKGKKEKARQVSKQIIVDNNAAHRTIDGNSPNLKKKKKEKRKLDTNSNANETDSRQSSDKKEKRKRKRSHTENPNDEESGSKSKRVKTEKDGPKLANAAAENTTPQEGKTKRKRNRKKKNNSKKNKYKHLALNSKDKVPDPDTPDAKSNGGIPNRKEDSRESVLSNKKTKEMKKVIQTAQTVPVKQTSSPKSISTQSKEKKAEKRKHDEAQNSQSYNKSEENHQDVADKKKKKKKHKNMNMSPNDVTDHNMSSHKEVTDRSLALPAKGVAQTPVDNTPRLKTLSKPKLKQHILAKMLNGIESPGQSETQEKSAKKKQKKKKDKLKQGVQRCDAPSLGSNLQQLSPKQTSASSKLSSLKTDKAAKNKKEIQSQTKKPQPSAMKIASDADSSSIPATKSLWGKAAELQQNAKEKLDSARFRFINEQLYTCKGDEALDMFREDKEAFSVYHQGFENQVKKWPVNPQNVIIKQLKEKPTELVIADFGCGDAKLAQSLPHKVHSFDLVALNKRVTVCDMSKTPLPSEKVDIAVFCLSLMGTNINDYIAEANRILKTGGLLKIAEVVSRFSGVSGFIEGVCSHGFQLLNKRDLSQMFYMMDFKKVKSVKKSAAVSQIKLKPCVYKRR